MAVNLLISRLCPRVRHSSAITIKQGRKRSHSYVWCPIEPSKSGAIHRWGDWVASWEAGSRVRRLDTCRICWRQEEWPAWIYGGSANINSDRARQYYGPLKIYSPTNSYGPGRLKFHLKPTITVTPCLIYCRRLLLPAVKRDIPCTISCCLQLAL